MRTLHGDLQTHAPANPHLRLVPNPHPRCCRLLTNHALALVVVSSHPDIRLAELAERIDVTERAAQRIVHELDNAGYLHVGKRGRCNSYRVVAASLLRQRGIDDTPIERLLNAFAPDPAGRSGSAPLVERRAATGGKSDEQRARSHRDNE